MKSYLESMPKRRSLTPRLAALLHIDQLFAGNSRSTAMPTPIPMEALPISFPDDPNLQDIDALTGTTFKGQMRLEEDQLRIEYHKQNPMSLSGKQARYEAVTVSLREIEAVEFRGPGWLHWGVEVRMRFQSLQTLNAFPRHYDGELRLKVPFKKRDAAADLVNAIKLARADLMLDDAERERAREKSN